MTTRRTTPSRPPSSPNRRRPRGTAPKEGFLSSLLDPIDRLAETIYSVLIILSFTLAYRILRLDPNEVASPEYVNQLLVAVLWAILAWGVIDGIVYVLVEVFDRGQRQRLLWKIQAAPTEEDAVEAIAGQFDYYLETISSEEERRELYMNVLEHFQDNEPRRVGIKREDLVGALACVLVAFISVLPALIPLALLPNNHNLALRLSNLISFGVLFYAGFEWGRYTRTSPWRTGLLVMGTGGVLVLIALLVGG